MMSRAYHSLFSWRQPINENVVGHHDGSISVMVKWDGLSFEMLEPHERDSYISAIYQSIHSIDGSIVMENHNFRYYDESRIKDYIDYADNAVRQKKLATYVRKSIANVLSESSMTNDLVSVFVLPKIAPKNSIAQFRNQDEAAKKIKEILRPFVDRMPGARFLNVEEYGYYVQRANSPTEIQNGFKRDFDHRFMLNEQWCSPRPTFEDGFLKHGDVYVWLGLLDLYPDETYAGFFEFVLDGSGAEYQISQIIKSANTKKIISKLEQNEKSEEQGLFQRGGTFLRGKIKDIVEFKNYVADNNIPILNNTLVVRIQHRDKEALRNIKEMLSDILASSGARLQDSEKIQRNFWRITQAGQGYLTKFSRPDAADLIINMAPLNCHDLGAKNPLSMRITNQNTLVYFDLPEDAANSGFCAGKTRSGKGLEKLARILENYPMGIDQYMIEYGGSYGWCFKALEGTYIYLDPDKIFINPLPSYEEVEIAKKNNKFSQISAFSIQNMALILTGGKVDFDEIEGGNHHYSRAQNVFGALYEKEFIKTDQKSPRLDDFFELIEMALEAINDETDQDYISFKFLKENLRSFLSSPVGEKFNTGDDNLDLSGNCIGIDIKPLVDTGDKKLLEFYLISLFMRLTHKVISNRDRAELAIDEYHIPAEMAPDLLKSITSRGVKTWAKENSHLEILSQSPEHFKVASDVLAQINHRQFMYMENGHEAVQQEFNIPLKAFNAWQSWNDPSLEQLKCRYAIRQFGHKTYYLKFVFPEWLLVLGDTRGKSLNLKAKIEKELPDASIWEWIERFNELSEADQPED